MLQAAMAWDGLSAELGSAATSFNTVTSGLTDQAWQGPAAQAMSAAAAPYAGWLSAAAVQADNAAQQARSVAGVFETAKSAVVHPLEVAANRNGFVRLVMSNFFGQNAPAIAAAEASYEQMWARDVDAMLGYHAGAAQAAAALTPLAAAGRRRDPISVIAKIIKDAAKQADNARMGKPVQFKHTPDRKILERIQRVEQKVETRAQQLANQARQDFNRAVTEGRRVVRNGRTLILHGEDVIEQQGQNFVRYVRPSKRQLARWGF